jgi:hypothetical protein
MKTLLTVGCSFTDQNWFSKVHPEIDCSFLKWPEVLGDKLGYKVVNLGKSGNSNDGIFKSAQDYIIDHKVDMICALWSQGHRLNIHDMINVNWAWSFNEKGIPTNPGDRWQKNIFNTYWFSKLLKSQHTQLANEHLRYVYMLDQLGKYNNNIPVYHMQGPSPYHAFSSLDITTPENRKKEYLKAFLDSQYFAILDEQDNIWGWPFWPELGGRGSKTPGNAGGASFEKYENRISKKDSHPNASGHKIIASRFMEIIK